MIRFHLFNYGFDVLSVVLPELFITGMFSISIEPSANRSKLVLGSLIDGDDSDIIWIQDFFLWLKVTLLRLTNDSELEKKINLFLWVVIVFLCYIYLKF